MALMTNTKNMIAEGLSGTAGFAGGGVFGSAVENTVTPLVPALLGAWTGAAINFAAKYFAYTTGVKYLPSLFEKGAVKEGIATNAFLDLAIRALNGGIIPAAPTLFGYQLLGDRKANFLKLVGLPWTPDVMDRQRRFGAMPNPDMPDFRYGGDYSPAVQGRHNRYGAMPYGAMPFTQPGQTTGRQTHWGFSADKEEEPNYSMFGML